MKYTYSAKAMDASEALKMRVEKKLGKMEKYFRREPEAVVRFKQQKGGQNIVEITLTVDGLLMRAEETTNDMYLSIDRAVDKLESQVRRHRTKLEKRIHTSVIEAEEVPVYEEPEYDVVRVKRFTVKPMSVEDAITQMDMLGHSFFLFSNAETGTMNVIYRRNDGAVGLLMPEE